jgi:hypothetical protein
VIFLLHIPKTAGSALYQQLAYNNAAFNFGPDDPPALLRHIKAVKAEVIRAHCDTSALKYLPPHTKVITMLRDPIDRIYSLFRHASRTKAHELSPYAATFDTLIHAELPNRNCDNAMTRRLAGIFYQDIEPTESHLDHALENLAQFWHVGFCNTFSKTIRFINANTSYTLVNRGAPIREVQVDKDLERRNLLDIELYNRARACYG